MPLLTLLPFLGVDTSQPLSCLCSWDKCSSLFAAWTCKPGGVMMGSLVCLQKPVPHCLSFYPALENDGVPIRCLPDSLDYGSCHDNETYGVDYEKLEHMGIDLPRHFFVYRDGWIHKYLLIRRGGRPLGRARLFNRSQPSGEREKSFILLSKWKSGFDMLRVQEGNSLSGYRM